MSREPTYDELMDAGYQKEASALPVRPIDKFRNTFAILHNVDMEDLEDAGLISRGDNDKWTRFNNNLTTFVLKLGDERLGALYRLVESRQPERWRDAV